jgi:hypothetical protein
MHSPAFARIECHYFINGGFSSDGQLPANAGCLATFGAIIQAGTM